MAQRAIRLVVLSVLFLAVAFGVAPPSDAGSIPGTLGWRLGIVKSATSCAVPPSVPYALVGDRSTRRGSDCAGLVMICYNEASVPWAKYGYRNVPQLVARCMPTNNPQIGDVVLFYCTNPNLPGGVGWKHCGIFIGGGAGNGNFIHCNIGSGNTIVDNLYICSVPGYAKLFWQNNFKIQFGVYTNP